MADFAHDAAAHPEQVALIASRIPAGAGEHGAESPGLANQLAARARHDTAARLGGIGCPTFVCGGRFDGLAPPANSEFLAGAIPGARLALFDGGHLFLLQDDTAMPAVIDFLGAGAQGSAGP
jgi:3-oxoadipate enol-lactonase